MKQQHYDAVRVYLQEIGRYPLLKHEEELALGKQIQSMMKCLDRRKALARKLGTQPNRSQWAKACRVDATELDRILHRGKRAQDKLVRSNLRFVVSIAKKYQHRGLDFMDLIQEGNLGLYHAAEKFDPTQGYKFSTYSFYWIRQAMTRAIANQSRMIRLPIHMVDRLNRFKKVRRELSQTLRRSPTHTELAAELEMSIEEFDALLSHARPTRSIDALVRENGDTSLIDVLAAEQETPAEVVERYHTYAWVRSLMSHVLNEREQHIVMARSQDATLKEIGDDFKVSKEAIRQLYNKALDKIRQAAASPVAYKERSPDVLPTPTTVRVVALVN